MYLCENELIFLQFVGLLHNTVLSRPVNFKIVILSHCVNTKQIKALFGKRDEQALFVVDKFIFPCDFYDHSPVFRVAKLSDNHFR